MIPLHFAADHSLHDFRSAHSNAQSRTKARRNPRGKLCEKGFLVDISWIAKIIVHFYHSTSW